jgi:hypothetical protein
MLSNSTRAARVVAFMAVAALSMHVLDLATAFRMINAYGPSYELNPLARHLWETVGPTGLGWAKLTGVVAGVVLLVRLQRIGRPHLAAIALLGVVCLGWLGSLSNGLA